MLVSLLVGLIIFKKNKDRLLYTGSILLGVGGLGLIASLNSYLDRADPLPVPFWIYFGLVAATGGMFYLVYLLWKRTPDKKPFMILVLFFITLFYTYLIHQKSSFIWRNIHALEYMQFPWRLLSITIFGSSFLAGSIAILLNKIKRANVRMVGLFLLLIGMIWFYKDYFDWREYYPKMTDHDKLTGKEWRLQITGSIFDYLPIWAPLPPPDPPNGDAELVTGQGAIQTTFKNSFKQEYQVVTSTPSVLQINTYYFPGWVYQVNGQPVTVDPTRDKLLGRPWIDLEPGTYTISAVFTDTLIRTIGNYLSLFSWLLLILIGIWAWIWPKKAKT
jgi:hypothetical protein